MYSTVAGRLPWRLDSGIHARNDKQYTVATPSAGGCRKSWLCSLNRRRLFNSTIVIPARNAGIQVTGMYSTVAGRLPWRPDSGIHARNDKQYTVATPSAGGCRKSWLCSLNRRRLFNSTIVIPARNTGIQVTGMYSTVAGRLPWRLDSGIHARNDKQYTFATPSAGGCRKSWLCGLNRRGLFDSIIVIPARNAGIQVTGMYSTVAGRLPWRLDSGIHARNDEQNTFATPSAGERGPSSFPRSASRIFLTTPLSAQRSSAFLTLFRSGLPEQSVTEPCSPAPVEL